MSSPTTDICQPEEGKVKKVGGNVEVPSRNLQAAAMALHQLAQPLTVLQGLIELNLLEDRSPEQYRECLNQAFVETSRLVKCLADAREAFRS